MAVLSLEDDENGISKVYTLKGMQDMTVINESGPLRLVVYFIEKRATII